MTLTYTKTLGLALVLGLMSQPIYAGGKPVFAQEGVGGGETWTVAPVSPEDEAMYQNGKNLIASGDYQNGVWFVQRAAMRGHPGAKDELNKRLGYGGLDPNALEKANDQ